MKTLSARTVLTKAAVIFMTILIAISMLPGSAKAYAETGPAKSPAIPQDIKLQIVGTPTVYVQSGNENIFSVQVKNISSTEVKGVNVCHGFPSMDDYYDENGGFVDGYSSQTTTQPGYEPETWYRFTTNFEKTDYAAVNAVWDSDEEGYTIGAGKTATLWFKVRSKFEEPGTYNEWIKFGDVHTELVGGFYPIPIVDKAFSGECAVKVVTYNPSGAAITHGTSENHGFDITPVAVGSTIDFGTVDLTKETGLTAEREYITRNTSTGYNGDITKDEHGQTSDITVDLDMEYSTSIDWRVGHPFTLDTNLSYGMHWSPLPAAPMSSNQFQSATTGVGLNATYFIAGTYTADLVLNTMPHGVKVNGSAIHTNGRYTWPVKVTLTGTNPRIPKAPVNVIADPGNGQVEITWNAAAGEETSQFEVYRREGTETAANKAKLNTAQFNWNDYEWVGNDTPDSEGNYLVVDGQVENGKTYTYVVIGGDPLKAYPAFAVRKGSTSTDVTPDSSYQSRLQKPDRFYGNEEQGGVRLEWEMNENYGGDSNDGSSMVDHFNIYRDGVLVMQVQQNAVIADPYYGWGPEPDDPDTYTYHLLSVEYGWECFVETPEIYQNYTWNVAAVSKSGVEGYWSDPDTRMGVNDDRVEITGHNATVNLDWDYPYWDDGDYDTKVEVLSVTVSPWFTDPHNAYIESVDYWRAEGTNAPDTTAAPYHTKVTEDYGNVETVLTDTNVTKGKTYTYTVHLTSSDGVESNYHTFTVKVPTGSNWYTADYSSSYVTWSTVNGRKAQLSWYADYEYDDYSDWHYIGTYKVYRNNTLIKTYTASGKEDGELLYTDDPGSDGTYVYRMDKVINGITIRGREFTFVRDTKPVDESTLLKAPGAPLLDIRVSDGNPILRWAAGNQGGAVEGYHIYRKDAGTFINGHYNSSGHWPNMRYITIDDPSVTSLTDIYGAFVEGDPSKGYLEGVAWSESVCPHEYWITAYNQAGESEPSQVISLSGDGEDEYGNPLPPANSDDYPPGTPDITKLWIDWDDESNYSTEWDSMVAGYIHVAWEDAPGTAASIDSWDVNVSGLKYNWPESLEAWKAEREPDAKLGTSDRYSPKIYIEGDPGDDGDLGRTASVTVTAKNSAGSTVSAPETILVTSFPQFRALPGNASAKLQWTDLYKDSETTVTAWEIRRKGEFTPWETVATISTGTLDYEKDKNGAYITDSRGKKNYTWTDTNIDNGWTYEYKVVAKCGDNIDRESVTREVAPVYSAALETPGAPRNLSYDIVNGEVIFTWDPPAEGTAQRYYVMYEYQRSYDDTPSWNWIADAFAPSTSAVWAPREAGSYRCFVYSRSYINGSDVPYMPYEGSFEEQYPTASNIITVTIDDDQIAQQADDYPGSFTLTAAGGENKITLNWTASEGATYYEINRRSSDDGTYFNTVTLPAGTTSYVDTSTIPGVRYQYDVTAKNSHGGVYNRVIAAATGKTKDQAAAESVAVLIDALPDPDDVTLDDADAITETKALYDGLTKKQQNLIDSELRQKLADDVEQLEILQLLEKYSAITDPVQALIDALPDAENVTLDDEADIAAARAA
ncbi:MAG: fibronectin type III domain-containing protein, partial [Eubacterium sp.]|nr:fibronectin type III domain-containing protein [Eubacterium sp.]